MSTLSLQSRIIFKALERTRFGRIELHFEDGPSYTFGDGEVVSVIRIRSEKVLLEIFRKGDIALAEAIVDGTLQISDESRFVQWACQNDDLLQQAFHGTLWGTLWHRIRNFLRKNTVAGAKKNIMAHYDLGNDFYSQWLDPSMSYSSALFASPQPNSDLQEAQRAKYDRIIEELDIRSGDRVLEIGCGWGGFFSRAIEKTDCHVTAVMNSPAQAAYNKENIRKRGLEKNVNLALMDYREISGTYDKVVSIEMIEAVGEKYWPVYFSKLSQSLRDGGKALIQSITIREDRFAGYRESPDFINSYIFPGGMLLTNSVIARQGKHCGLNSADPFEFGISYAETLKQWRANFNAAIAKGSLGQFDDRFFRLWNFYLSYCEGAFRAQRINVGHYLLEK